MSSRSIGQGTCPKCGRRGTLVIKTLGGGYYAYYRHGKSWCYLGPLNKVYDEVRKSLDPNYVEEFDGFVGRVRMGLNESVTSVFSWIGVIRMGIMYLLILGITFYILLLMALIVMYQDPPLFLLVGRILDLINNAISLVITYMYIYNGFLELSKIDKTYGLGFGGSLIRLIALLSLIVFDSIVLAINVPAITGYAIKDVIGAVIVIAWALIFTPIYRLSNAFNIKPTNVGIIIAMIGYALDLVPGIVLIGAPIQFIGEGIIVHGLGKLPVSRSQ